MRQLADYTTDTLILKVIRLKVVNRTHSYGVLPDIWDHSVTCHLMQVNTPRLNHSQRGLCSINLPRRLS